MTPEELADLIESKTLLNKNLNFKNIDLSLS